ncbi:hypothetical protein [Streptomyces sp. SAS_276]|uniref:hypothetical protein n=1 Tax=Streptomyces sp. SAS_276 TaxID=3412745 RepID=UPI00403C2FF5
MRADQAVRAVVLAQVHWRQRRGPRHAVARAAREEPAGRVVLEPTLILPPER